ncbi:hypothetical protein DOY81_015165 [Sarcophaga bullata]|nr:hypothetical protein DOY81_015165 [Sarcophaga bullata]
MGIILLVHLNRQRDMGIILLAHLNRQRDMGINTSSTPPIVKRIWHTSIVNGIWYNTSGTPQTPARSSYNTSGSPQTPTGYNSAPSVDSTYSPRHIQASQWSAMSPPQTPIEPPPQVSPDVCTPPNYVNRSRSDSSANRSGQEHMEDLYDRATFASPDWARTSLGL